MSHVGHPTLSTRSQLRAHWIVALSALAALVAATAVAVVLFAGDNGVTVSKSVARPQAAIRTDGGPNESAVAASIAPQPSPGPSESTVAAAVGSVGSASIPSSVSDEAARASLVAQGAGPYQPVSDGPDEAATAAAISAR